MTDDSLPPSPPRLLLQDGETAELLRSADLSFRESLDESGAFRRIERARRRRTLLSSGLAGAGAVAAIVALALGAGGSRPPASEFTVTAEPLPPPVVAEPALPVPVDVPPAARLSEPTPADPLPVRVERSVEGGRRMQETVQARPVDEALCRKLEGAAGAAAANGRDAERALECYRTLARAGGLGAEVASYKAARISAESLRDAPRTLRMLDEHDLRFPSGALRVEVRWLRIQSLERAGRLDEALADSEALLAAAEGRALSADLHWLRARIYEESRGDCERAASELVALVGEKGARGDEAEMRRAACFARLGKTSEARAAYQRYLERAEPRRAEDAKARLEALRP